MKAQRCSGSDFLNVEDLHLWFGGQHVLAGVTLGCSKGEILGIIGPNGAGKTSLINCLSGVYRPASGRATFQGVSLVDKRPHDIAALGIARTFQMVVLLPDATVLDNLLLGAHTGMNYGVLAATLGSPRARRAERSQRKRAMEMMARLGILRVSEQLVGSLAWGEQKRVEIARALMLRPSLVLLDEPTSGMTGEEKEDIRLLLKTLRDDLDLTEVIIEHDPRFVADLCDRILVLNDGRVIADGPPTDILNHPDVRDAYLGSTVERAC